MQRVVRMTASSAMIFMPTPREARSWEDSSLWYCGAGREFDKARKASRTNDENVVREPQNPVDSPINRGTGFLAVARMSVSPFLLLTSYIRELDSKTPSLFSASALPFSGQVSPLKTAEDFERRPK